MSAYLWMQRIEDFWESGGGMMLPIAVLCFLIYFTIWELFLYMNEKPFSVTSRELVEKWVVDQEQPPHEAKELMDYVSSGQNPDEFDIRERMKEVRSNYMPYVDRRLVFLGVLVSTAPLMGLLGTVNGMFLTFKGLSVQAGRSIDFVAKGISEALITTQTGLLIAIPAYALLFLIYRKRNEWISFFCLMECALLRKYDR